MTSAAAGLTLKKPEAPLSLQGGVNSLLSDVPIQEPRADSCTAEHHVRPISLMLKSYWYNDKAVPGARRCHLLLFLRRP